MFQRALLGCLLTLLTAHSFAAAAPFPAASDATYESSTEHSGISDLTVQQLERLKSEEAASNGKTPENAPEQHGSVHIEMQHYDSTVKQNGELVSRLTQKGSADSVDGRPLHVNSETELEVPKQGIHKIVVQNGSHVAVKESSQNHDTIKEKVFRGAARLVQPSSVAGDTPPAPAPPAHTITNNGNRRFFNADITSESNNNMDHYTPYRGIQYSPVDMAEYVFWTGDEKGVTTVIEDLLHEGLMTKDEAIAFLQEVKFNIDYLKAHYARQSLEDNVQQERAKNLIMEQADKEIYNRMQQHTRLRSFPFGNSADIIKTIANKNYELSNNVIPAFPVLPIISGSVAKRTLNDPMLSTNIINTSDYDRESTAAVSEEEYEDMMDKLRAADSLYTQYTLEEVIYQLAKMMFTQSLSHEPMQSRHALQRFMSFLELESERGQLSRNVEKKVLDVMISALSDAVADHPELVQSRDLYGLSTPNNRFAHPIFDMSVSEPPLSRALLAAYKEEMARGQLIEKSKGLPGGN